MSFLNTPISIFASKQRQLGSIKIDVIISETTNDTLTITKQPVQQGASITDHAYKEPTAFACEARWKDNIGVSLSKVYQNLLDLQNSRTPFTIVTPKRIYNNMLINVLTQTTDKSTENCLAIQLTATEVIIVPVTTTQVPRSQQKNPGKTGATQNAGKKSALATAAQGIQALFQ